MASRRSAWRRDHLRSPRSPAAPTRASPTYRAQAPRAAATTPHARRERRAAWTRSEPREVVTPRFHPPAAAAA
eukprot:4900995-Prymnesium_polylepis.1